MARRVRFVPDHRSFGEFMRSDQMRKPTAEVAHAISERAGELSPRRKSSGNAPEGEALADSFHVNIEAGTLKVAGNVRVKVEVFNSKPSAAPNEFGSKRNKRHRMLGRAGSEFGDFKPEGGLNA